MCFVGPKISGPRTWELEWLFVRCCRWERGRLCWAPGEARRYAGVLPAVLWALAIGRRAVQPPPLQRTASKTVTGLSFVRQGRRTLMSPRTGVLLLLGSAVLCFLVHDRLAQVGRRAACGVRRAEPAVRADVARRGRDSKCTDDM